MYQKLPQSRKENRTILTLFCTFLYRPCTTMTWKCLIASFMADVNKRRRISFSLSKLECGPQEINFQQIRLYYICNFQQIGVNATKIEKTGIHFKTDVFAAVAVVDAKGPYSRCELRLRFWWRIQRIKVPAKITAPLKAREVTWHLT